MRVTEIRMIVMGGRLGNVLVGKLDKIENLTVGGHLFVFTSAPVILLIRRAR